MVRRCVERAPVGAFVRSSDFGGRTTTAVDSALSRIARERLDLIRVRKGLYWKGVTSRYGPGRPDPTEAAIAAAGPGSGPSGVSAANVLGLTNQVPAVPTVAVVGRRPTGLRGVRFVARSNVERHSLRPAEVALVEVLREFPTHVDVSWDELVVRVREQVAGGRIRVTAVVRVSRAEHSPALRARVSELRDALPGGEQKSAHS